MSLNINSWEIKENCEKILQAIDKKDSSAIIRLTDRNFFLFLDVLYQDNKKLSQLETMIEKDFPNNFPEQLRLLFEGVYPLRWKIKKEHGFLDSYINVQNKYRLIGLLGNN